MSAPLRGQEPKHRPPSLGLLSKYPRNVISLLGAQFAVRELVAANHYRDQTGAGRLVVAPDKPSSLDRTSYCPLIHEVVANRWG